MISTAIMFLWWMTKTFMKFGSALNLFHVFWKCVNFGGNAKLCESNVLCSILITAGDFSGIYWQDRLIWQETDERGGLTCSKGPQARTWTQSGCSQDKASVHGTLDPPTELNSTPYRPILIGLIWNTHLSQPQTLQGGPFQSSYRSQYKLHKQLLVSRKCVAQLCHFHDQEKNTKLSPAAERKLLRMIKSQPSKSKSAMNQKLLEDKWQCDKWQCVLHQHGLRGCCARKKLLLQMQHLKA